MRRTMLILAGILIILFGSVYASAAEEQKTVTVMIYMSGCDLESDTGAATTDMLEMLRSGFDREQVNVVLFTGGTSRWKNRVIAGDGSGLYTIEGTREPTRAESYELMDMGDPETLCFFLQRCRERYPADAYILIFWNHGGGPLLGVCVDRVFDNDVLTMSEIRDALEKSGIASSKKLRLIGFDACLMSSLEVATACAPYAEYMVASQELEPGKGWNYTFLKGIERDGNGAETGSRILGTYFSGAAPEINKGVPITMACIDLSRINELNSALDPFFRNLTEELSEQTFARYSINRRDMASVARSSGKEYDLVDLRSVLEYYSAVSGTDTSDALAALEAAVVYQQSTVDGLTGLTVYFPFYNKDDYRSEWSGIYSDVSASANYAEWISRFGTILTGDYLTDWHLAEVVPSPDNPDVYTLQLTPEQRDNTVSAEMLVMMYYPGWGYIQSNRYTGITPDPDGVLRMEYDHQCFYPIGQDGQIIGGELPFREVDGFYLLRAQVVREFSMKDEWIRWVNLRLKENEETGLVEIVDATFDSDDSFAGRNEVDFSEWEGLAFVYYPGEPVQDENGFTLPYEKWDNLADLGEPSEDRRWIQYSVSLNELAGFGFRPDSSSAVLRFVCFQILDVQGNQVASDVCEVNNPNTTTYAMDRVLADTDEILITLDRVQVNRTQVEEGMTLYLTAESRMTTDAMLDIERISVNDISLAGFVNGIGANILIDSGESCSFSWTLSADMLQNAEIRYVSGMELGFEIREIEGEYRSWETDGSFDIALDISDMVQPARGELMASAETGGLGIDIYDWDVETDGSLVFDVCVHNRTGRTITNNYDADMSGSINGFSFGLRAELTDFFCKDGQDWYGKLRFRAVMYNLELIEELGLMEAITIGTSQEAVELMNEDCFFNYGISRIEEISLTFGKPGLYKDAKYTMAFYFPEPLRYAEKRGMDIPPLPDYPVVVDTDTASIRLESLLIREDKVTAVFFWENTGSDDITFGVLPISEGYGEHSGIAIREILNYQDELLFIAPGDTARVVYEYQTDTSPLPITDICLPVMFGDYWNMSQDLPSFTVHFDTPVTETGRIRDGFTVIPGTR